MQKKSAHLSIGIASLLIGFILTFFYRPFIYKSGVNDYGFADTIGSLISVVAFCNIIWGLKDYSKKEKNIQIGITTFIYAIFWEFLGYFNIYGTFDRKDIIAGIISGIITYFINTIIEKRKIKT